MLEESVFSGCGLQSSVLRSSRPPSVSCCMDPTMGEAQGMAALPSEGASEGAGEDAQGGKFLQPNSGCDAPLLLL